MNYSGMFNLSKDPVDHLVHMHKKLDASEPFQFVRFSDGEIEILCERELVISEEKVVFRGEEVRSVYGSHDCKSFSPASDIWLKESLKDSASFSSENYIKGIPTSHNSPLCQDSCPVS